MKQLQGQTRYLIDTLDKKVYIFKIAQAAQAEYDRDGQPKSFLFRFLFYQKAQHLVHRNGQHHIKDDSWLTPAIKKQAHQKQRHISVTLWC